MTHNAKCLQVAKAYKKAYLNDFDDKSYNDFIEISKILDSEIVEKIKNEVNKNINFRPIDIVCFKNWASK